MEQSVLARMIRGWAAEASRQYQIPNCLTDPLAALGWRTDPMHTLAKH